MDQDDRQYGGADGNDGYSPEEQEDKDMMDVPTGASDGRPASMTHTAPHLDAPSKDTEPSRIENSHPIEAAVIGPEIEPTTVAYSDGDVTQQNNEPKEFTSVPHPMQQKKSVIADKKRTLIIAAVGLVLLVLIGGGAWWLLFGSKTSSSSENDTASTATVEQPKLGIHLSVVDGTVEFSSDGTKWQSAAAAAELKQGDSLRTGENSRAIVAFDDGSMLRLDAATEVKFESLVTTNVIVRQIAGSAYSRVAPSDRTYVVTIDDTSYKALGTAFATFKSQDKNGVQVFESSVAVSGSTEKVSEGKQYFIQNSDAGLKGKITDLDVDALADNIFIGWNIDQDEKDTAFKEKLGVLSQIKQRIVEKQSQSDDATVGRSTTGAALDKVTRGIMTLGLSGSTFTWNYTGKAIHGYKLVYSKTNTSPTLDKDSSVNIADLATLTGSLPSRDVIGDGKYYVRVCAYTASNDGDTCVDYSNVIIINLPLTTTGQ